MRRAFYATGSLAFLVWVVAQLAGWSGAGTITKPYTFTADTTALSSNVNSDFDTIYSEFNGNIESVNILDGTLLNIDINGSAAIDLVKLNTTSADFDSSGLLREDVVDTYEISPSAVTATEILDGTITSADLGTTCVVTGRIATDAVGTLEIIDGSIKSGELADSSVVTGRIATDAVGTLEIIDGSVTSAELADSSVVTGRIAADAVGTLEIIDNAVTWAKVATSVMPVGTILDYGGSTAPAGWLLCGGQAVSRATYSNLFTVIGTVYGVGDGVTTFNVPDLRGRVGVGKDNMDSDAGRVTSGSSGIDGDTIGAYGGTDTHTLTSAEMPAHAHALNLLSTGVAAGGDGAYKSGGAAEVTDPTGGDGPHLNMQPSLIVLKIINTGGQ